MWLPWTKSFFFYLQIYVFFWYSVCHSSVLPSENCRLIIFPLQVSSAWLNLRQRNTYPAHSLPRWMKSPLASSGLGCTLNSLDNSCNSYQELGSNVVEIVNDSRHKAQAMVDTAIQVWVSTTPLSLSLKLLTSLDLSLQIRSIDMHLY